MNSYRVHYRRFHSVNPTRKAAALLVLLLAGWAFSADVKPSKLQEISSLVSDLSADDAATRQAAAAKLVDMGIVGRPAVLAAAHSDDPETREQAAAVLLQLPWAAPDDPQPVRDVLDQYTHYVPQVPNAAAAAEAPPPPEEPEQYRIHAVAALAALPDFQGINPLIRLAQEDPSAKVRWAIYGALRTSDDGTHLVALRKVEPPADDAPLSAICGSAWLAADADKAAPLLRQAVTEELAQPSGDDGELDYVIQSLTTMDLAQGRYQSAANLLRSELKRDPAANANGVPDALPRLLALDANHGPLKGEADDLAQVAKYPDSAEVLYAASRIEARSGQTAKSQTDQQAAFKLNETSRLGRFYAGKFLADSGWDDAAEAEFKAFLALPPGDEQGDGEAGDVNVHFDLGAIAFRRGDLQTAADEKKNAMSIIGGGTGAALIITDGHGYSWPTTEDSIWAEIHSLYLQAAVARKDDAAIDEHLKELVRLKSNDEDIAIDVVPVLRQRRGEAAARQYYAAAYALAQSKLAADPANPSLMNGLAWLDAKCDENLDEAMKMSTAAVTASPNSAAAIDTLAEVNYHLGKFSAAVALEERALKLQPGDKFMTGQLAKFKAGK